MSEEVVKKKKRVKPFPELRILYVEDEEMARMSLSSSMRRYVGEVYEAQNGEEGLEQFKTHRPDIVVTDINMPRMNGLEMSTHIKELNSEVPIIVTSAYNDTQHLLEAINLGIDQFLIKPVEFKKLFEILEKNAKIILSKKAVQHSEKLQREYKKAVDASAILSISDKDGNITYANDKLAEISGYSTEELIGENHRILKHPDMFPDIYKELWATITRKEVWRGRLKNRKKDGSYYYVDSTIIPILDEHDEVVEYMGIRYDVTNLIEAQEQAENASQAKSEFLANMSHEIRTPMNGVIGFLDILAETDLDNKQNEYVSIIKASANHLVEIINDILDLSKIESGKLRVETHPFRLKKEIEHCLHMFYARAREKYISLQLLYAPDIPKTVKSDPVRIRQVLANLISNAIKFTPEQGSVSVNVSLENSGEKYAYIQFAVQDTGIGIPKEKQANIFTPFEQADVSTTRKFGGTGLGLSISTSLVEIMGGELQLESEEGKGSRFYFTLPVEIVEEADYTEDESAALGDEQLFEANVLVAEDNPVNQKLIKILLESVGLQVHIAANGQEALEYFIQNGSDMIFMDINMPVMDGILATEKIIEHEQKIGLEHTPIVALTANALQGDRDRFSEAGMDEYLTKPVEKPRLYEVLNRFLSGKKGEVSQQIAPAKKEEEIIREDHVKKLVDILGINEEIAKMLLDEFFSTIDSELDSLKSAIEASDSEKIRAVSHSIKGASANLRLEKISEVASKMQKAVDTREETDFSALLDNLSEQVRIARSSM